MTVLDVRAEGEFLAARLPDSVNIPVEEMAARVHELPAGGAEVWVYDRDGARVKRAVEFLEGRGHVVRVAEVGAEGLTASGRSTARLWRPNAFLEEAMEIIGEQGVGKGAIDIACGTGRDAVYLGTRGYQVTAIDYLPDAVERAVGLGARYGVRLNGVVHDLEKTGTVPGGEADLVCVFRYLHRPLWAEIRRAVGVGGYVVYETFHERNLETGRSPRSPGHLLKTGELREAFEGFEVLIGRDVVEREGRFFSHILARRVG